MMLRIGSLLVIIIILFATCGQRKAADLYAHPSEDPLERLMNGNDRFSSGHPVHPDETLERIRNLKKGQHPFAVVVSCSDSRVPPELVFDQGFGDIFSIRTAGNVIGDYELGSIEYAVEHLECRLVMVMGHENCGAVDAYIRQGAEKHHDHVQKLIDYIHDEVEEKQLADSLKTDLNHAVLANILHGVHVLKGSEPILKGLYTSNKIRIVGAMYDLDNGKVSLVE